MDYSDRLLNHGNFATRLAHRSRLKTLFDLLSDRSYDRALDLGCADGWLLDQLAQAGRVRGGVGIDTDQASLEVARRRFEGRSGFDFITPDELVQRRTGDADLLICTETLEHVADAGREIANLARWGAPHARLIVSVPIEVGPSLIAKQLGRYLANKAGRYGYDTYEWSELVSAGVFWDADSFDSTHRDPAYVGVRSHKGFDFRKIRRELERFYDIERALFTPFPALGSMLNSTAFYLCSARPAVARAAG